MKSTSDVIVVGAGAAGLLAAISAAESDLKTIVLEKNRKPGVKILMSGGTRCNITQDTDHQGILSAFGPQGRFLRTAIGRFGPTDIVKMLSEEGLETKVEPTGKIFPQSDRAADVLTALLARLRRSGAELVLERSVCRIDFAQETEIFRVVCEGDAEYRSRTLVLTTGGMSYPGCGTIGEGYRWARQFGHPIIAPHPALVPLKLADTWIKDLSGITIPDAQITIQHAGKTVSQKRNSLLFTHFGISGPAAMDASRAITASNCPIREFTVTVHLAPEYSDGELDQQLRNSEHGKSSIHAFLITILPKRLASAVLAISEVPPDLRVAELPRDQRRGLVNTIVNCPVTVTGTMGFKKAEVTAGGVSRDSVNAKTMESKLQPGLYFAGEVLDVDGPIGGYNFQAAFSTGWLAGKSIARSISQNESAGGS